MILSGFDAQQNFRINNINLLEDSNSLWYNLNNRVDDSDNIIQWGDSVVIGIDNVNGSTSIVAGTDITIFDLSDTIEWSVYKVSDHWIIISNLSTDSSTSFSNYYNIKNPNNDDNFKIKQGIVERFIRKSEISKNYETLNVEMNALDTLSKTSNFGNMKMKADLNGGIIVYDLSLPFYIELQDKNIEGTLFDLCISSDDYKPIIRGLKFEEKVRDLDYLIFSYYTNNSKQYIIFTTRSYITEYAVYPDIYITDNLYNNIANDYRVPSLFNNMMNDIYSTEFIDLYSSADGIKSKILTSEITYCKEVSEGDIIRYNKFTGDSQEILTHKVLSEYLVEYDIVDSNLKLISHDGKILLYSSDVDEIKEQYLNNLLLEFEVSSSGDRDFRLIQIFYNDEVSRKELLYQCYLPLTTIFASSSKTFRIII